MAERIILGTAFITDKGIWSASTIYEENDIVHTDTGVYMSLADNNTSAVTDTAKWRVWLDKADINDTVDSAVKSAEAATATCESYNGHPAKIGDNDNWWQWNVTEQVYEDTGIVARAGVMYPTFKNTGNKLYIVDYGSNVSERVVKKGNKLAFRI